MFPDAGSPFSVPVSDTVDSTKVKCQGPGLGTNVRANIPQAFTVDASKAGVAPLQVRVQGPKGRFDCVPDLGLHPSKCPKSALLHAEMGTKPVLVNRGSQSCFE